MAIVGKQLAQVRPGVTSPVSLYSPGANIETQITAIIICNTTAAVASFSLYHDDDGTTYDADSQLYPAIPVAANDSITLTFERGYFMNNAAGNLAAQSSVADALNFTVSGLEKDV